MQGISYCCFPRIPKNLTHFLQCLSRGHKLLIGSISCLEGCPVFLPGSALLNVLSSLGTYLLCKVPYHIGQVVWCSLWALGLNRRGCRPHHPHLCMPSGCFLSLVCSRWGQRCCPSMAWGPIPVEHNCLLLGSGGLPPQLLDTVWSLLLLVQLLSVKIYFNIWFKLYYMYF